MDECEGDSRLCGASSVCVNFAGSFRCDCRAGFTGAGGRACVALRSCERDGGRCHPDAQCVEEAAGSGRCECREGFAGDGELCEDVNECEQLGEKACGRGRICTNTRGSFFCDCAGGFRKVGSPGGVSNCQGSPAAVWRLLWTGNLQTSTSAQKFLELAEERGWSAKTAPEATAATVALAIAKLRMENV